MRSAEAAPACVLEALPAEQEDHGKFLRCATCSRLIDVTKAIRLDPGRCPDEPEP